MSLNIGVSSIAASNFSEVLTTSAVTTQASGSTFVLLCSTGGGLTLLAPTDNKGNTYTLVPQLSVAFNSSLYTGAVWICSGGVGGSGHTFTFNSSAFISIVGIAVEITSSGAVGVLDQSATTPNINNVTTANSPSITPTVNNAVVLSFLAAEVGSNITINDSTGYNNILQSNGNGVTNGNPVAAVGALVQTTAGATNDIFTLSATSNAGTITFSFQPFSPPTNSAAFIWIT